MTFKWSYNYINIVFYNCIIVCAYPKDKKILFAQYVNYNSITDFKKKEIK